MQANGLVEPGGPLDDRSEVPNDHDYLIGLDSDTLIPLHTLILGGHVEEQRLWEFGSDALPLSGDATRFVPVIVRNSHQPTAELQMVDLDEVSVSTSQPITSRSLWLQRFGARTYLAPYWHGDSRIVAYDGETGQVTGEIDTHDQIDDLVVRGDRAWIKVLNEVSALDARTLQVLWTVKPGPPGAGEVVETRDGGAHP